MSASVHPPVDTANPTICPSCGAIRTGRFCSACGEEVFDHHSFSLRHFFGHTVVHEFLHVDGKVGRSLFNLLFRPGFLSSEYFAGRKGRYLNPLRLMLTAAILFALFAPPGSMNFTVRTDPVSVRSFHMASMQLRLNMMPPSFSEENTLIQTVQYLDYFGFLTPELARVKKHVNVDDKVIAAKFNRLLESYGEILSFCSIVPVALTLWLFYRGKRRYFVEHLVFSLHLEAFLLLLGILVNTAGFLMPWASLPKLWASLGLLAMLLLTYGGQAWYLQNGLTRFYEPQAFAQRYNPLNFAAWRTASMALLLFLANSLFLSTVHSVGAAIALWRL